MSHKSPELLLSYRPLNITYTVEINRNCQGFHPHNVHIHQDVKLNDQNREPGLLLLMQVKSNKSKYFTKTDFVGSGHKCNFLIN